MISPSETGKHGPHHNRKTVLPPTRIRTDNGHSTVLGSLSSDAKQPTHTAENIQMSEIPVPWLTRLKQPQIVEQKNLLSLGWRRRVMKRTGDIVISATLLILLSPVMLLVAALVRLTSPGPVIFKQERVGVNLRLNDRRRRLSESGESAEERRSSTDRRQHARHGRPFMMYKFRSMRTDAEKDGAKFATAGDPRVTPLGRFMRRTRIDELPQLWNILRGDMSFVGPRPERPVFVKNFVSEIPGYQDRLGLKPGLTGLAQIENGYDNSLEDFRRKAAYDRTYLTHCCFRNDLKIMARTIGVVISGKGAL